MKLLIIAGAHPTSSQVIGGLFITRNIKKLNESGIQTDVVSYYIDESIIFKFVKKLLGYDENIYMETMEVDTIQYNFISLKRSLLTKLLSLNNRLIELMVDQTIAWKGPQNYDLIHAHWVYPHGYVASLIKKETKIPCIISALGSDIHTFPHGSPKTIPLIVEGLEDADIVFFVSNALLKSAQELGYRGTNYKILSYGVDTELFLPAPKKDARIQLGLEKSVSKVVGFVGNLISVKGVDRLPDIFNEVSKRVDNVQFIFIGVGDLREELEERCKRYNLNVLFLKQLKADEIVLWMNAFDILVLPSRNEGLPNVILEAQSCGCPVVGSDAGGIPEAIGPGGMVVAWGAGFEERFSDAIIKVMNEPPDVEQLREWSVKYDWREIIKEQIKVYESVIKSYKNN
ncbi:glycosyltransferase [Methanocalculus chunghsingensis]|uniref:glycosyltransferase n=1 Tax=Methanocalculus chunghsingensis TaxID=156457 RepID=UPI001B8DA03A|nr:glycosyltransferase [Methanocalculus chunghsingensis]